MKQLKETTEFKISSSPRFRYWTTPPEFLSLRVSEIEAAVPKGNWIASDIPDHVFQLPAAAILSKNVPRISLRQLAEILPERIRPSDGLVKLPAARLAVGYKLVVNREELPAEVPEQEHEDPAAPADEGQALDVPAPTSLPEDKPSEDNKPPAVAPHPPEAPAAPVSVMPTVSPTPPAPGIPKKISPRAPGLAGKMPPRREGSFIGLPIFRRKSVVEPPPPAEVPTGEESPAPASPIPPFTGIRLPRVQGSPIPIPTPPAEVAAEEIREAAPEVEVPEESVGDEASGLASCDEPFVESPPAEETLADAEADQSEARDPAAEETLPEQPEEQIPAPDFAVEDLPAEEPMFVSFPTLDADPASGHDGEITEQEPLQALFLTEETLSVGRVIELCGSLPGINSCVLTHGSLVVASHNVPESIDLVSMSAHAADMLQSMRESSARMGIGTVPAVTLHTEKGVISFFHRDDLTMLVFHKDRGFIPGVREKMAAVLGELTKSRLTLPAGSSE